MQDLSCPFVIHIFSSPMRKWVLFQLLCALCLAKVNTASPIEPLTRILFVLDASSSMYEAWGRGTKLAEARRVISALVDTLASDRRVQLGLRVYGHQYNSHLQNCTDTRLEVPLAYGNAKSLKEALNRIRPLGVTPIAYALEQAATDFPVLPGARNVIILLTDGLESCGGDPCAVSAGLQKQQIILKPFVIGLNMSAGAEKHMECIGYFFNVHRAADLEQTLSKVMNRILQTTGLQVNLLDAAKRPTETDVVLTFTDAESELTRYNYFHTLTVRGEVDTLPVDPIPTYHLTVHTTPPLTRRNVHVHAKHPDTINIPAAQGFLRFALEGTTINQNLNNKIKAVVYKANDSAVVDVLSVNETRKLLAGTYRMDILTMPIMHVDNIVIQQSITTTVSIPLPGILSLTKNYAVVGSLLYRTHNRWIKLHDLVETVSSELIGLQPGTYLLVYRAKGTRKTADTQLRTVTIRSGQTLTIRL